MKTEIWNNHEIRFVEKDGEWWAVAADVCAALGLKQVTRALSSLKGVTKSKTLTNGGEQELNIIDEKNIYRLVFKSRKPEAEEFQDWVFDVLKTLRKSSGLAGFEIFRMLDKEHQKAAMSRLSRSLEHPVRVDFIRANTIANKAVSDKHHFPKMVKKADMTPDMLAERQLILDSTVELMAFNEKYNLGISVSEKVHEMISGSKATA